MAGFMILSLISLASFGRSIIVLPPELLTPSNIKPSYHTPQILKETIPTALPTPVTPAPGACEHTAVAERCTATCQILAGVMEICNTQCDVTKTGLCTPTFNIRTDRLPPDPVTPMTYSSFEIEFTSQPPLNTKGTIYQSTSSSSSSTLSTSTTTSTSAAATTANSLQLGRFPVYVGPLQQQQFVDKLYSGTYAALMQLCSATDTQCSGDTAAITGILVATDENLSEDGQIDIKVNNSRYLTANLLYSMVLRVAYGFQQSALNADAQRCTTVTFNSCLDSPTYDGYRKRETPGMAEDCGQENLSVCYASNNIVIEYYDAVHGFQNLDVSFSFTDTDGLSTWLCDVDMSAIQTALNDLTVEEPELLPAVEYVDVMVEHIEAACGDGEGAT